MRDKLQEAITLAAKGLPAVAQQAFQKCPEGYWRPRPKCLFEYYSSGEAVVCSILLCLYMEMHSDWLVLVEVPADKEYINRTTDIIWPGGYYFVDAINRLSNEAAWAAIRMILPQVG